MFSKNFIFEIRYTFTILFAASWNILNQPYHKTLDKYGLTIQPFFRSLHDVLFENQRENNSASIESLPTKDTEKDIFGGYYENFFSHFVEQKSINGYFGKQ